jgi:hypothetical protein
MNDQLQNRLFERKITFLVVNNVELLISVKLLLLYANSNEHTSELFHNYNCHNNVRINVKLIQRSYIAIFTYHIIFYNLNNVKLILISCSYLPCSYLIWIFYSINIFFFNIYWYNFTWLIRKQDRGRGSLLCLFPAQSLLILTLQILIY